MKDYMETFAIIFICGMMGIVLAFILYLLHINGIVIDEYVTGSITIENIMAITIIVWAMVGVMVAVIK